MLSNYTNEHVGSLVREAVDHIAPAIAATYTAGFLLGQFVHSLNDRLIQATR